MTDEKQFGYRIKRELNRGLDLDDQVLARLKAARQNALDALPAQETVLAPALAGNVSSGGFEPRAILVRFVLPLLILVLGIFAADHLYQLQITQEIVDIDADVLLGELPIDAYLDKGFDAWLKRSSE